MRNGRCTDSMHNGTHLMWLALNTSSLFDPDSYCWKPAQPFIYKMIAKFWKSLRSHRASWRLRTLAVVCLGKNPRSFRSGDLIAVQNIRQRRISGSCCRSDTEG